MDNGAIFATVSLPEVVKGTVVVDRISVLWTPGRGVARELMAGNDEDSVRDVVVSVEVKISGLLFCSAVVRVAGALLKLSDHIVDSIDVLLASSFWTFDVTMAAAMVVEVSVVSSLLLLIANVVGSTLANG